MRNILTGRSSGNYRNDISAAKITATPSSVTYTGNPFAPPVMVELDGIVLKPNDDYSVRYVDNVSVGKGMAVVEGKGMYVGTNSCEITILPVAVANTDLSTAVVTVPQKSYTYSGSAITPEVTVKINGANIALGTDYSVTYSDNVDIGTAKITITAVAGGTYKGSQTITFSIVRPDLKNATVTLNAYVFSYTGTLVCPVATVKMTVGQTTLTLVKDVDYELSYSDNGKRGTARATVTGKGGYAGTKSVEFQIGKDLSVATVDILSNTYPYTGYPVTPEPVVTLAGSRLSKGVDYSVSYSDNIAVGLGRVVVTGIGDYIGSVTVTMNIDNSENEAWDSIVLSDRMFLTQSVSEGGVSGGIVKIRQDSLPIAYSTWSAIGSTRAYGHGDRSLLVGDGVALPDGSFIAFVSHNYGHSTAYGTLARFSTDRDHVFDIKGGYLNPVPVSEAPARKGGDSSYLPSRDWFVDYDTGFDSFGGPSPRIGIFNYGRILVVPRSKSYRVKDTGGSWAYDSVSYYRVSQDKDINGNTIVANYRKCVVLCDLEIPYDLSTYGNERIAYVIADHGNDVTIHHAMFTDGGNKFLILYFSSDNVDSSGRAVTLARFRILTLKEPYVLYGDASVESVVDGFYPSDTLFGANFPGATQVLPNTLTFSPDGRYMFYSLRIDISVVYQFSVYRLSVPWDIRTATLKTSTSFSHGLATVQIGSVSTTIDPVSTRFLCLFLPKHGKMIVSGDIGSGPTDGGYGDVNRQYGIVEYAIA